MDLIIRNATLIGESELRDIGVERGRIVKIAKLIDEKGEEEIDARGNLVSPGFVDCHAHLDKALTGEGERVPKYNSEKEQLPPYLVVKGKVEMSPRIYKEFTVQSVKERAIKCAKMYVRNGITALRTHVDINSDIGLTGFKGVLEAKKALKDLLDIQIVAFPEYGFCVDPETEGLVNEALRLGADLVGGQTPEVSKGIDENVDITFSIAKRFDVEIDSHNSYFGTLGTYTLERFAEKTIEEGLQGRVTNSHCIGLATAPKEFVSRAIQRLKESNMKVVTCYSVLYPNFPLRELLDAGVTVGTGGDNIRDWWNPFGTADILQGVLNYCDVHKCGMRSNERLRQLFDMITVGGAKVLGIDKDYGLAEGRKADMVILEANSPQWAIITQARKLYVIKNGKIVARNGEILVPVK